MEHPSVSETVRCVTHCESQDWIISLSKEFDEVLMMLTMKNSAWDWTQHEMPSNVRYVRDFEAVDVACSVVPMTGLTDGLQVDLFNFFRQVLEARGLPMAIVDLGGMGEEEKKVIEALKGPHDVFPSVEGTRFWSLTHQPPTKAPAMRGLKQRWQLASHPAWIRHGRMLEHLIGNHTQGTLVELDCGDGALLSAMRQRLGGYKITGYCRKLEEKKIAMSVEADLDIRLGEPSEAEEADVVVVSDVHLDDLNGVAEVALEKAKRQVILSLNKTEDELPAPWDLKARCPGGPWTMTETLAHYYLVNEKGANA